VRVNWFEEGVVVGMVQVLEREWPGVEMGADRQWRGLLVGSEDTKTADLARKVAKDMVMLTLSPQETLSFAVSYGVAVWRVTLLLDRSLHQAWRLLQATKHSWWTQTPP
jgi:hypothetical protein